MKSVALHVPNSSHHAGFWNLFRGLFHIQPIHGITQDSALPKGESRQSQEEGVVFFQEGEELEDYIRSFRE